MNSKLVIGVVAVVVMAVGIFTLTNNGDSSTTENTQPTSSQQEVVDMSAIADNLSGTIQEAIAKQSDPNVVVLDVRTDAEWNEQHAVDAVHWGLAEHIQNGEMPDIDRDAEIYVYCRSGNRSGQAIRIMQEAGFTDLTNIGGLDDWIAAGGETTSGIDGSDQ